MNRILQRFEARFFRFWGAHGALVARILLALYFVAEAIGSRSPRADITGEPLDAAAQALSIITMGRVTFAAAPGLLGLLDVALAALLLAFVASRLTAVVAVMRALLALTSLLVLHDGLFVNFPLHLNAFGWGALASLLVCGGAWLAASSARWQVLQARPTTAGVLIETTEQIAVRLRRWKRFAWTFAPLTVIVVIALPFFWPHYLTWFHARQEAAALDEHLSGRLLKKSMPSSKFLNGRKITTWVYLPPGYDNGTTRYPVVYVMHGMPGEVRDCFVKGRIQDAAEQLIKAHQIRPLILVGWDGQGPGGSDDVTNYLDRPDYKMESFVTRELVPYVDRTYRTISDARFRALDGISAGGYAAPNLLFKHPDIWKIASSHTGFFSPRDDAENMTAILGPLHANAALWNVNDPTKTVLKFGPKDDLHVYLDIGQGDELLPEFKRFAALLQQRGIDHEAQIFPGRHTWEYWSTHFYDSLRFADKHFPVIPLRSGMESGGGSGMFFAYSPKKPNNTPSPRY